MLHVFENLVKDSPIVWDFSSAASRMFFIGVGQFGWYELSIRRECTRLEHVPRLQIRISGKRIFFY